jgi:hypothetical protein
MIVPEFVHRELVAPDDRPRFDDLVTRALRLRNSLVVEAALALLALTVGHWIWRTYASLHGPTWYAVPAGSGTRLTAAGYWYGFVSLPISRFILLRWYFRFFVWCVFLWRVSRLRLRLNPLHADHAGGLGFLEDSAMAFALILVAQSAFFAMVLGNRIWHEGRVLSDFVDEVAALVSFLVVFVLLPLVFFSRHLFMARLRGVLRYGRLASAYADAFQLKWMAPDAGPGDGLLGTGDIQSLSDLANSYDVVHTTRAVPFGKAIVLRLVVIILLPLAPLTLTLVPLNRLAAALLKAFV